MKFRILFLSACLLATTFLGANNTPAPFATSLAPSNDPPKCDLPAPTNFHIISVGTDWIKFGWAPANAFDPHRIRTYRASDNFLLNTTIAPPGSLEAVIQPLPSGEACYGVINAICPDGSNSTNESVSEIGTTLIIDLLVEGLIILPDGSPVCSLETVGYCEFPNDQNIMTTFKVYNKEKSEEFRKFGVKQLDPVANTYRAFIKTDIEEDSPFYITCENGGWPGPICEGPRRLEIWYDDQVIAEFTAYEEGQDQISALDFLQLNEGYVIEQIEGESQGDGGGGGQGEGDGKGRPGAPPTKSTMRESGNTPAAGSDLASASPNPFSELLDVYLPQKAVDQVQLQLFNLSGQKVLDQQFSGGQNQYTLSTQNLANGFYLLRIEADGNVQTLKVVKSE